MTAAQCRMARAALHLGVRELAKLARVAPSTVSRLEVGESLHPRTIEAIRRAFEQAGVEFIDGEAPGVRLKKPPRRS
jgi:transcriptional regulator with XRE-family HTH domain